jgi:hypothetical protein
MPIPKKINSSLSKAILIAICCALSSGIAFAAGDFAIPHGQVIVSPDALLSATAGGLDQTGSTQASETVSGMPFDHALVV